MQDHIVVLQEFLLKEPAPLTLDQLNQTFAIEQFTLYATAKEGAFTTSSATTAITFQPVQDWADPETVQDIINTVKKELAAANTEKDPLTRKQHELNTKLLKKGEVGQVEIVITPSIGPSILDPSTPPEPGRSYFLLSGIIPRPFSRGSVHIHSSDPLADPIIDPRYLNSQFDLKVTLVTMKAIRKVVQAEPLKSLIERPWMPAGEELSDEEWEVFIKKNVSSSWHTVGTVAMAPRALGGVVDENLLVYGTSNLRVVDASIIPLLFAAHTQATVYAVAERAADIIAKARHSKGEEGGEA